MVECWHSLADLLFGHVHYRVGSHIVEIVLIVSPSLQLFLPHCILLALGCHHLCLFLIALVSSDTGCLIHYILLARMSVVSPLSGIPVWFLSFYGRVLFLLFLTLVLSIPQNISMAELPLVLCYVLLVGMRSCSCESSLCMISIFVDILHCAHGRLCVCPAFVSYVPHTLSLLCVCEILCRPRYLRPSIPPFLVLET